jgi:hypothetical protein
MLPTLDEITYRLLPRVQAGAALADSEWRTLAAAASVLLEGEEPAIDAEHVADNVERFLINGRSQQVWRIRLLLTLLEYLPLSCEGRTFSQLDLPARQRLARERLLSGTGLWQLCARVRLLLIMGAYGDAGGFARTNTLPVMQRPRFNALTTLSRGTRSAARELEVTG